MLLTERKKGTKQDEEYTEEGYNIDSSHWIIQAPWSSLTLTSWRYTWSLNGQVQRCTVGEPWSKIFELRRFQISQAAIMKISMKKGMPEVAILLMTRCCRSKPTGEKQQATRRAGRLPGRWLAPVPRSTAQILAHADASGNARRATWPIPDQKGANVLSMVCLHAQIHVNISPSLGRLPGTTLASL